jgi:hypothetical protein
MLEPQVRRLLLDMLRPPEGYRLDFALGTTYTLDLTALLLAPLAFTFFEWEGADGKPTSDPVPLLEALRRNASRIRIFHQSGRIHVPSNYHALFSHLEDSLVAVAAKTAGRSFHPKVWLLRYASAEQPIIYRFLCLSRNLTLDRDWDTGLVLQGPVIDRKNAVANNHPLGNFIAALPTLARSPIDDLTKAMTDQMQQEVRRVSFELPDNVEDYRFWPLGVPNHSRWPFQDRIDRMLVVAPFLGEKVLEKLVRKTHDSVLISRPEALTELPTNALNSFGKMYVMAPETAKADQEDVSPESTLSGLHTKLYIAEAGWNASVWTGSANATHSAYGGNVEFLVEMIGKKSKLGIDAFLQRSDGDTSFGLLLQEYVPSTEDLPADGLAQKLRKMVDEARLVLCSTDLSVAVYESEKGLYKVRLETVADSRARIDGRVKLSCWPISTPAHISSLNLQAIPVADFGELSLEGLTPFIGFEVVAEVHGQRYAENFVLNLTMRGAPPDRREKLLINILRNRGQLLRLLFLLLSEGNINATTFVSNNSSNATEAGLNPSARENTLLESLVLALAKCPSKLDGIAAVLKDLGTGNDVDELLPEGFRSVWEPIWEARRRQNAHGVTQET